MILLAATSASKSDGSFVLPLLFVQRSEEFNASLDETVKRDEDGEVGDGKTCGKTEPCCQMRRCQTRLFLASTRI